MLATGSLVPNISIYIYRERGRPGFQLFVYTLVYIHIISTYIFATCYVESGYSPKGTFVFFFDSLAILVLYLSRIMFQWKMDPRLVSEMHSFTSLVTFLCSLTMGESGYGGYTYPVVEGSFHEPF